MWPQDNGWPSLCCALKFSLQITLLLQFKIIYLAMSHEKMAILLS